jgi:cytochrome c oxidase subunit 2
MLRFPPLRLTFLLGFFAFLVVASPALADSLPRPWQLGFPEAASPVKEQMDHFHDILMVVITLITIFVTVLLAYTCIRFRAKRNPVPSKTTHNTLIEIIWTAIPVIILVLIAIPSIRLLYYSDHIEKPDMTLKVIGYQWYWGYVYPDNGNIAFESYLVKDEDLKPGQIRLLDVDKEVVLPIDTNVRVLMTASDVIHAWAVPALGVKKDAVPGRLNETWLRITKPGVYYGQCSELCGQGHGFMPIKVRAVTKPEFAAWVASHGGAPAAKAPVVAPQEEIVMPAAKSAE